MSSQETVRQQAGPVDENAPWLDQDKAEQIAESVEGLLLHEFLEDAYERVEKDTDEITERLAGSAMSRSQTHRASRGARPVRSSSISKKTVATPNSTSKTTPWSTSVPLTERVN